MKTKRSEDFQICISVPLIKTMASTTRNGFHRKECTYVRAILPENIRKPAFSDLFRGYRKSSVASNGLSIVNKLWAHQLPRKYQIWWWIVSLSTAQKMKFSIEGFFSKCDQIRRLTKFLRIWSCLLKKSFMENLIFLCSVVPCF